MKYYSFKSNFLDLNGIKYHYLDEGTGDPIVMLHGNPTWSYYYRNLVKALMKSYRVIVPDHIGCGLSDKPSEKDYNYTLEQRAKDVETLLDHLGINKNITLVLHDWGGMIGMLYASKHPKAVQRFVVFNTSAFHLPKSKGFPWQLWLIKNTPLGAILVQGLNAFTRGTLFFGAKKSLSKEIKNAYFAPYDSWKNRIAILKFVKDIPVDKDDISYNMVNLVQKSLKKFIDHPMLICWGEKDFIFDNYFLQEWLRRFPKANVHRFSDAGHYVLEDASEEIIPIINTFLIDHPLRSK